MKRLLFTLAAVLLTASVAEAGPLRNLVQRVRGGGCGTCHQQQTAQPQQYQPGPVVTAAGTVLVGTGQVIQAAGQTVQAWPGLGVVRPTTCSGGTCSGGVCR